MATEPGRGGPPEWNLLVYSGTVKNDFDLTARRLAASMKEARPSPRVDVLFEIGSDAKTQRGRISPGSLDPEILADGPRIDTAAPRSIAAFVDWAAQTCPSRHTALFLKDHGGGNDPANPKPVRDWIAPTPPARAAPYEVLDDGEAKSYLSNRGLRVAIDATQRGHVDLLGLDACTMAMTEIAFEVRGVASYFVATEESLSTEIWPYAAAIDAIGEHEHLGPRGLASTIADAEPGAMLVAVELSWMNKLAADLDAIGAHLSALARSRAPGLTQVRASLTTFPPYNVNFDLLQLLATIEAKLPDERRLTDLVERARETSTHACYAGHPPRVVGKAGGLGIFFPPVGGSPFITTYGQLQFAQQTRWAELVAEFCWPG